MLGSTYGIFGDDAPAAPAAAAPREIPTTFEPAQFRIGDQPYLPGNVYPEFAEQEDLSIFGWTNYPDPVVGLGTYAQDCLTAKEACYAAASRVSAALQEADLRKCDAAYSACFAGDPSFLITQPGAKAAAAGQAVSGSLLTLGLAAALGAGVAYGVARLLLHAEPGTAALSALAGGVLLPGIVVAKFVHALEMPTA